MVMGRLPWIDEVCVLLAECGLLSVCVSWVREEVMKEKGRWDERRERREKMKWKSELKEKIGVIETKWMVGDGVKGESDELIPKTERKMDLEYMVRKRRSDGVLRLCSGELGYFGGMVLRNRLTLPGEKKSGKCLICRKEGKDEMKHLLGTYRIRIRLGLGLG